MAFITEKEELKPGLILFRRGDVDHRMWYCRMKIPKANRYKTISLKTTDLEVARERAFDDGADLLRSRRADLSAHRPRLLRQQIVSCHLTEGMIEHRNVMLDAKPDIGILVEGPLAGRADIRRFKRNRFIAVGLRHLHAAIPHPVVYIAAPEENQAGFQLLFLGNKRHVASCVLFRSVQFPCRLFLQAIDSSWLCRRCMEHYRKLCTLFLVIYDIVLILSEVEGPPITTDH